MNSLMRWLRRRNVEPMNEEPTHTAGSRIQEVPLEEIFGIPEERTSFVQHRLILAELYWSPKRNVLCHSSTPYSPAVTSASPSPMDERSLSLPIVEQTSILPEQAEMSPSLQFSIYHDIQRSTLTIYILEACFPAMTLKEKRSQGVFVSMCLERNREECFESKLVPKSHDLEFREAFDFCGVSADEVHGQRVIIRVCEAIKRSKETFLGSLVVPLDKTDLFGEITTMTIDETGGNLPGDSMGELLVSLTYHPLQCFLRGSVVKATNLPKPDPYVKVHLVHKGVRQAKWKTSVKRNSLTPVFNESFQFNISEMDVSDISLEFVVMDYDRFSRNDLIGVAYVGRHESTLFGHSHWEEVLCSIGVSISRWHPILPDTPLYLEMINAQNK